MKQEQIKVVTILANENKYNLNPFRKRCSTTHKATLIEFIYETGIEIPNVDIYRTSSQELAFYLSKEEFIVVLQIIEKEQKETIIYLPEILGEIQKRNLNTVISKLEEDKLSVFKLISKDDVFTYCEGASKDKNSLTKFLEQISVDYVADDTKQPRRLVKGI